MVQQRCRRCEVWSRMHSRGTACEPGAAPAALDGGQPATEETPARTGFSDAPNLIVPLTEETP